MRREEILKILRGREAKRLWEIVKDDLPSLRQACELALEKLRDRESTRNRKGRSR